MKEKGQRARLSAEKNSALNLSENKSSCRVEKATQMPCTTFSLYAASKWIQREIYFIIIVIIILMSVTLSSLLVDFMHAYTHTQS